MISSLVSAAAAMLLLQAAPAPAQDAPASVEGVVVEGKRTPRPAPDLTDAKIEKGLFQLLETQPQRVVCAQWAKTGTRLESPVCGSVERWFNAREPEDVAAGRAPWQLVEEIKRNKRKAASAGRRG